MRRRRAAIRCKSGKGKAEPAHTLNGSGLAVGRTWVAIVGDEAVERASRKAPLLLLHGGPGACHDYLESLAAIAATGRRVIFYDQQGCGNSDQPDDPGRWTVDFYLREIETVRRALGLERAQARSLSNMVRVRLAWQSAALIWRLIIPNNA